MLRHRLLHRKCTGTLKIRLVKCTLIHCQSSSAYSVFIFSGQTILGSLTSMPSDRQHVLVLGLGLSGFAAAGLALHTGHSVTVLDENELSADSEKTEALKARGVNLLFGWNTDSWSGPADLCVISPGIPPTSVLGRVAANLDCPVISELEFGYRHTTCPILAITGTNGKTTTTELVTHCLRQARYRVASAGNIGAPLCDVVRRRGDFDFLAVEVSSFQLERVDTFAPLAAAILNLSPDHLDRHPCPEDYYAIKAAIFRRIPRAENVVLRADITQVPAIRQALAKKPGRPILFSSEAGTEADFLVDRTGLLAMRTADGRTEPLIHRDDLRLRGRHNMENALAAIALCHCAGVPVQELIAGLRSFAPSAHRLELVSAKAGVQFINDSKATNPDAMARAILAVAEENRGQILLIAGGLDKGLTFEQVKPLLAEHVKAVFLIGKCREALARQWGDVVSCKMFASMASAVEAAVESAESGDTVLLSPGCASFDMFRDYAERGRIFSELVKRSVGE
jgi:UDP-N-acetylmuramoylalanine--D-glutamate ligase